MGVYNVTSRVNPYAAIWSETDDEEPFRSGVSFLCSPTQACLTHGIETSSFWDLGGIGVVSLVDKPCGSGPPERTHVFVNAVVGADSTHCSISSVGSTPRPRPWRKPSKRVYGWTSPRTYPVQRGRISRRHGVVGKLHTPAEPGGLSLQVTFDSWDDPDRDEHDSFRAHLVKCAVSLVPSRKVTRSLTGW